MKKIAYVDQSARDLALNVTGRHPPDMGMFTVLQEGQIQEGKMLIKAFVIGESHAVLLEVKGRQLCEVLSCAPIKAWDLPLVTFPLPSIKDDVALLHEGISYQFGCNIHSLDHGKEKLEELQDLVENPRQGVLALGYDFPSEEKEVTNPKTIVVVDVSATEARIRTAHSYPNEGTVVFSTTQIKI